MKKVFVGALAVVLSSTGLWAGPSITSPADYSTVELLSPGLKTYNTAATIAILALVVTGWSDEPQEESGSNSLWS